MLLLRLPYLDVPISADEGGYATAAYWWARGDTLYQNITITRPQGIFVVFRLIEALGLGSTAWYPSRRRRLGHASTLAFLCRRRASLGPRHWLRGGEPLRGDDGDALAWRGIRPTPNSS